MLEAFSLYLELMLKRVRLITLGLVVVGFVLLLNSKTQAAQPQLSLTTSPITLGLNIKPGITNTQTLQLMNNTGQPVQITMQLKTFGAYGDTGQASIYDFSQGNPQPSWIKFSPSNFTAQPHVWSYVKATIAIPNNAVLGYYYAIVFQPAYASSTTPGVANIKGSNAILLLVDTGAGNEQRQLQVATFTVSRGIYQYLPAYFSVNIRNSGNIFVSPTGDIFISRRSDGSHTINSLTVNSGGGNVLPNSNRVFTANWNNGFPVYQEKMQNGQPIIGKNGQPEYKLVWNWANISKFRIGKYYAKLALTYNNGTRQELLTSTVSFWVIPWVLLLIALAIIVLILFAIYSMIRSIVRRFRGSYQPKRRF